MTEIAVTNVPAAAVPPPPAADAKDGAPPADAAAKPAPTPEEIAKAKELEGQRVESRELAEAKSRQWRAQQEAKEAKAKYEELSRTREADLKRIKEIEELESTWSDPDKFLDAAEKRGLTAQRLVKRAATSHTPDEVEKRILAEAEKRFEAKLKAKDDETAKVEAERMDKAAAMEAERSFIQEMETGKDKFPTISGMLAAGRVFKRAAIEEAWNIYRLAKEHTAETGVAHTPEEINSELEKYLAGEYGSLTQRKSGTAEKPSTANGTSESAKSAAAAPNVTDARANDLTSLSPDLPKEFKDWSEEKRNQYFIDKVRKR